MPTYRDYRPSMASSGGRVSMRDLASGGDNVVNLLLNRGQIAAEGAARSGDILANTITGAGAMIGQGLQQRGVQKAEEKKRAELAAQDNAFLSRISDKSQPAISPEETIGIFGRERGMAIHNGFASMHSDKPDLKMILAGHKAASPEMQAQAWPQEHALLVKAGVPVEQLPPPDKYDPHFVPRLEAALSQAKPAEGFSLSEGQTRFDAAGQPIANVPAMPKEPTPFNLGPGDVRYDGQGKVVASRPAAPSAPGAKFWVMRDGKPLRVTEGQYQPGDKPASTREQGRPVTSGDSTTIADFDTSLDDLNRLAETLTGSKATGVSAKVGAALPNVVTELTGLGSDAKQKQATIDRVKQVIGKTLEGGVLRKEDEAKYEKILPTIGDPEKVVAAKLEGLWKAISQRRQTFLESKADAGYDITKYGERSPRTQATPASAPEVTATGPNGQKLVLRNGQWVPAQ